MANGVWDSEHFPVPPDRAAKAKRWMLALQRQVRATWIATVDNNSVLCRTHGIESDVAPVGVELALALVAVRVLDLEVFHHGHGQRYEDHRASKPGGRVVDGMTLIRNAEVHLPTVVDPQVDAALSIPLEWLDSDEWPYASQYQLAPVWLPFADLPEEVRDHDRTSSRCKDSYADALAGRLVVDTLLDAVAFFRECDPAVAARDSDGELACFPLPEFLPIDGQRFHPLES